MLFSIGKADLFIRVQINTIRHHITTQHNNFNILIT